MDLDGSLRIGKLEHNKELEMIECIVPTGYTSVLWADDLPYHLCVADSKSLLVVYHIHHPFQNNRMFLTDWSICIGTFCSMGNRRRK
jgi:hypothetical protein